MTSSEVFASSNIRSTLDKVFKDWTGLFTAKMSNNALLFTHKGVFAKVSKLVWDPDSVIQGSSDLEFITWLVHSGDDRTMANITTKAGGLQDNRKFLKTVITMYAR